MRVDSSAMQWQAASNTDALERHCDRVRMNRTHTMWIRRTKHELRHNKVPDARVVDEAHLESTMTMTMTMTMTLREVQHLSMKAWPYRRECRGHDPAKKRICCTDEACSIGRVCTYTLLMTVCSTSTMRGGRTGQGTVAHQSLLFPNQIFLLWFEEVVQNCREQFVQSRQ